MRSFPERLRDAVLVIVPSSRGAPFKSDFSNEGSPMSSDDQTDSHVSRRLSSSVLASSNRTQQRGPTTKSQAGEEAKASLSRPASAAPKERVVSPMSTANPPRSPEQKPKRRFFLEVLLGGASAIGFTALVTSFSTLSLSVARFMFPNIRVEPSTRFKIGFPSDFPPGIVSTRFKDQFGVWIVNAKYDGEQQIYALSAICTHMGCTPNWLEGDRKFKCPCHGSGFYQDGVNFEGPAPRPLERCLVRIASDGQIEVDKGTTFREELGQWRSGESFVTT